MVNKASLGSRLAEVRKRAGLTQGELAESLDLDVGGAAISAWEVGRTQPSAGQLARISRVLSVSADYLLGIAANDNHKARA